MKANRVTYKFVQVDIVKEKTHKLIKAGWHETTIMSYFQSLNYRCPRHIVRSVAKEHGFIYNQGKYVKKEDLL